MKRIVVTGAESTGKTTLAHQLAQAYGAAWTPEYVRIYVDQIGREIRDGDLDAIARGQIETEDAPLQEAPRIIIHDTNLLSTIIYTDHYFNRSLDWFDRCFGERDYALYLLCLPDIPWVADAGQRESAEVRAFLHDRFKRELIERKLPYVEIGGNENERLSRAKAAIDAKVPGVVTGPA